MILNVQYDGETVYTISDVKCAYRSPAPSDISMQVLFSTGDDDYSLVSNGMSAAYLMSDTGDTIASYKCNSNEFVENESPYCKFSVHQPDEYIGIPPLTDRLLREVLEKCLNSGSAYLTDELHDLYGQPLSVVVNKKNNHIMLDDIDLASVYKKDRLTVIPYRPYKASLPPCIYNWRDKHPNIGQEIIVYFEYNGITCVEAGTLEVDDTDSKKELRVVVGSGDILMDQWLIGWSS